MMILGLSLSNVLSTAFVERNCWGKSMGQRGKVCMDMMDGLVYMAKLATMPKFGKSL